VDHLWQGEGPPMRRSFVAGLLAAGTAVGAVASAGASGPEIPAKYRATVAAMKAHAQATPGLVTRIPQGLIYFKWLQFVPPEYEKAYFKLGEIDKGCFLALQLVRRGGAGVELLILCDQAPMNGIVEEAFRGSGRTLQEADRAINSNLTAAKVAVTPAMQQTFTTMLDELRFELNVR